MKMMDTLSSRAIRVVQALTFPLLAALVPALAAQSTNGGERGQIEARINQLEAQLVIANGDAVDLHAELARLRSRLVQGDFRPGDAVAIQVSGEEALTDTFTVEVPRQIRLPGIEPIDLTGVLSDELQPYIETHVSQYVRDPTVVAYPLLRVAVTGAVGAPGYYMFRPETPVLDVFGAAGGFNTLSKPNDVQLKRSGKEIVDANELRQAMAAGWSLQQLQVRSADEFYVPAKPKPLSTREIIVTISSVVALGLTIYALAN
jgi:hypothetical protein